MLPLSKPVIATVVVLQFLGALGRFAVAGDGGAQRGTYATLPLAMQTFFGQFPRGSGAM